MNTPVTATPDPDEGATAPYCPPDHPAAVGKFVVLERLGQGSFGTVYKARDPELSRLVAIKVPRAGAFCGTAEEDRFLREARAAAQLDHPNVVRVLEVARADGVPYIVSEYVEGVTLADRLTAERPDFRTTAGWVAQLADALDHAHSKGVIHRDVKPGNILLARREGDEKSLVPRVADFGLARRDEGEVTITQEGQILGTPAYMSPEQAAGQAGDVDGRSDVYSLAVVLYELLTGELPFRGNQRMMLHQVLHDDPKAPRRLNDAVPRDLETVCLKAMAKVPSRRYATAGDLRDDLRRWMNGEPILARPAGRLERAWRWCKRKPAVAALTGLLLLTQLVIVAGSVGFALYYRETAERLDAARRGAELREGSLAQDRAVLLGEANNADAMLWLARALELQGGGAKTEQERYLRTSLAVWAQQLTPRPIPIASSRRADALFSEDASIVLTERGEDALLWDATSGRLKTVLDGKGASWPKREPRKALEYPYPAQEWRFSSDGLLAADEGDRVLLEGRRQVYAGDVRLWDVTSGKPLSRFSRKTDQAGGYRLSSDCRLIIALGQDSTSLRVLETTTRKVRCSISDHFPVNALAVSPDGTKLLVGDDAGFVELWDVDKGEKVRQLKGAPPVFDVAFSPDGEVVAIAHGLLGGVVSVWDIHSGRAVGPTPPVENSPGGLSGPLTVWFVRSSRWVGVKYAPLNRPVQYSYWDRNSLERVSRAPNAELTLASHDRRKGLAIADRSAWVFDAESGSPVSRSFPVARARDMRIAECSPDGRFFRVVVNASIMRGLVKGDGGEIRLFDALTGKPVAATFTKVSDARFTPDGKKLYLFRSRDASEAGRENGVEHLSLAPVEGDPASVTLWVQTLLGKELTPAGEVRPIDEAGLQCRKQRLAELGGPPLP